MLRPLPHRKTFRKALATLINSAVANAKHNFSLSADTLIIKNFEWMLVLNEASMPRAHGSAYPIRKRTSHITLILAPKAESLPAPKKSAKAVAEKVAPKKVVKAKATK